MIDPGGEGELNGRVEGGVVGAGKFGAGTRESDGGAGLIAGTLLASLFEIHAAAAAVVIQGDPTNSTLLYAMILGLGAHAISKSINATLTGGWKFARVFVPIQMLHMLVLISVLCWITLR